MMAYRKQWAKDASISLQAKWSFEMYKPISFYLIISISSGNKADAIKEWLEWRTEAMVSHANRSVVSSAFLVYF